jgi:hypothetical protein
VTDRNAQDALGAQLVEAARRDDEAEQVRHARPPRWRRPAVVLTLAGLLGVAAATAAAVNLISVGQPLPDRTTAVPEYRPVTPGPSDIVLRAADRPLPWGVTLYTAANGRKCALAGQLRGASLGRIVDGRFRPYEPGTTGACTMLTPTRIISDTLAARDPAPRTVLYGRAGSEIRRLELRVGAERRIVAPGPDGSFLFVFEGLDQRERVSVRPVDSRASGPE